MNLIRFDPSGAMHSDDGVSLDELRSLYPRLEELRRGLIEGEPLGPTHRIDQDAGAMGAGTKPVGWGNGSFYRRPDEQLADYQARREASELGRIFQLANSLIHHLDAIVVLGHGAAYLGALAMLQACCDPFHNELSRAARGSRPRMYFEGNDFDNDAAQALLNRLSAGGYGDLPMEARHAIVMISADGQELPTAAAFRFFLAHLRRSLGEQADRWLTRLVIPVVGRQGRLRDFAAAIGCEQVFDCPEGGCGASDILSAVGLLPAALLGLDCMRWLEGAAAMNRHFETAPPEDNVVMRYLGVNHLLAIARDKPIRVLNVGSKELEAVGRWHDQLIAETLGRSELGVTPLTLVNARDLPVRHRHHLSGRNDKVFNNLLVENHRTDPLPVGPSGWGQDGLDDLADKDLTELLAATIKGANHGLREAGRPTTEIWLPTVDTHALGQLFQMLMIATAMESRLLGIDAVCPPGGQPCNVESVRQILEST